MGPTGVTECVRRSLLLASAAVAAGLRAATWRCRFEVLQDAPFAVVIDGAHNPAGFQQLKATLDTHFPDPSKLVAGLPRCRSRPVLEREGVRCGGWAGAWPRMEDGGQRVGDGVWGMGTRRWWVPEAGQGMGMIDAEGGGSGGAFRLKS